MDVRVHGKNMQVARGVRELAEEKVKHAGRIFDDGGSADVEFTERSNPKLAEQRYKVEITTVAKGHTVRIEASSLDDRAALDIAVEKFERQLRRLKERLVQRHRGGQKRTTDSPEAGLDEAQDSLGLPRAVVRTKRFDMRPMSVDEAVLQMEMLGHDFFFFLDAETGAHSVLYHRDDGELGLIEPA